MAAIPGVVEAGLARLRAENARLLKLLMLTPQQAAPPEECRLVAGDRGEHGLHVSRRQPSTCTHRDG
jgi:hypothetical protein